MLSVPVDEGQHSGRTIEGLGEFSRPADPAAGFGDQTAIDQTYGGSILVLSAVKKQSCLPTQAISRPHFQIPVVCNKVGLPWRDKLQKMKFMATKNHRRAEKSDSKPLRTFLYLAISIPQMPSLWTTSEISEHPANIPYTRGIRPQYVPRQILDDAVNMRGFASAKSQMPVTNTFYHRAQRACLSPLIFDAKLGWIRMTRLPLAR